MKKRPLRFPGIVRTIMIFLILGAMFNVAVAWGVTVVLNRPILPLRPLPAGTVLSENPTSRLKQLLKLRKEPFGYSYTHSRAIDAESWTRWGVTCTYLPGTLYIRSVYSGSPHELHGESTDILPPEILPRWAPIERDIKSNPKDGYLAHTFYACGWPMYSLWCEYDYHGKFTSGTSVMSASGGMDIPLPPRKLFPLHRDCLVALPYRPIWTGALFNSLLYAGILWLLSAGLINFRQRRRIRRGLCGRCGYVVSVNAGVAGASPNCTECGTPLPKELTKASPN